MIQASGLSKSFGDFKAIQNLNLEIKSGECFGLLGPNGAGKSTFISMLYGTVQRTVGKLTVFGLDPATHSRDIKTRLGVVTQDNALDENLTIMENMLLYCAFVGMESHRRRPKIEELLSYMLLEHKKDALINTLSGGMKRRLVFVRALLGEPELLILDEPTTGLDPAVRHLLWGKVRELHQKGSSIILTTHYMHEAEVLCNRLIILNRGQISAEGSPRDLIHSTSPGYVAIFSLEQSEAIKKNLPPNMIDSFYQDQSACYLRFKKYQEAGDFLEKNQIQALMMRPSNLEDVFLKLTGTEIGHSD